MIERLDMLWRAAATGLCFAVFGLGQLILGFVVFPVFLLCTREGAVRRRLAKLAIHYAFKAFVEMMRCVRVLDYRTEHLERLERPGLLVLANHPSLIDVVFLISFIPQADCVIKASLLKNPFTRFAVTGAGYISNDGDPEAVVKACRASFAEGNSLIVFPEGTRSTPGQTVVLQRGSSQIAVRAERNMTPVVIRARDHNLEKGAQWWKVPQKRPNFHFTVNDDIPVAPFLSQGKEASLAARELTESLTKYFARETA